MTGGEWISSTIEEIPSVNGTVDSQNKAYFAYFVGGFPVSFSESWNWNLLLYRPGYEVIKVPSHWLMAKVFRSHLDQLDRKIAPDLDSQTKALECICPESGLKRAEATEEVWQFVAQEYQRLARSPYLRLVTPLVVL
jgi:hypothetical protein